MGSFNELITTQAQERSGTAWQQLPIWSANKKWNTEKKSTRTFSQECSHTFLPQTGHAVQLTNTFVSFLIFQSNLRIQKTLKFTKYTEKH